MRYAPWCSSSHNVFCLCPRSLCLIFLSPQFVYQFLTVSLSVRSFQCFCRSMCVCFSVLVSHVCLWVYYYISVCVYYVNVVLSALYGERCFSVLWQQLYLSVLQSQSIFEGLLLRVCLLLSVSLKLCLSLSLYFFPSFRFIIKVMSVSLVLCLSNVVFLCVFVKYLFTKSLTESKTTHDATQLE